MSEKIAQKISTLLAALEAGNLYDVVRWLNNEVENYWLNADNIREHAVAVFWNESKLNKSVTVEIVLDSGLVLRITVEYNVVDSETVAKRVEIKYYHVSESIY
jgi:hypothetical protein